MAKTPKDPLFAEYERTAPLMDLRFQLTVLAERRARGICYDGPRTAAIVADMTTIAAGLEAVIGRREKPPAGIPKSTAAQKRLVWETIDRYRGSLAYGPSLIDGRPDWIPDPYRPGSELQAVLSDPDSGPRPAETVKRYAVRTAGRRAPRPFTETMASAAAELRATLRAYRPRSNESAAAYFTRIGLEAPRPTLPEPISGAAAELLFWDAVRMVRERLERLKTAGEKKIVFDGGAFPPIGTAIDWSAERLEAERLAADVAALEASPTFQKHVAPKGKRRGASSASSAA